MIVKLADGHEQASNTVDRLQCRVGEVPGRLDKLPRLTRLEDAGLVGEARRSGGPLPSDLNPGPLALPLAG